MVDAAPTYQETSDTGGVPQAVVATSLRINRQVSILFVVLILAGMVGSFVNVWAIPVSSVVLFFVIGCYLTKDEKNTEKFADSLYYMGFIFTMWGLFIALGPFSSDVSNLSSKVILTQFGIKLSTTVIALTLRIILTQFRQTVSDQEEEARQSIATLVQQLNVEIDSSISALRNTRERMLKAVTENSAAVQEAMAKNLEQASTALLRANEETLSKIEKSVGEILQKLHAVEVPPDLITHRIRPAVEAVASDIADLHNRINASNTAFSAGLSTSLESLTKYADNVAKAMKALETFEKFADVTAQGIQHADQLNKEFASNMGANNRMMKELADVLASLKATVQQDAARYRSDVEGAERELREHAANIDASVSDFKAVMHESVEFLRGEISR